MKLGVSDQVCRKQKIAVGWALRAKIGRVRDRGGCRSSRARIRCLQPPSATCTHHRALRPLGVDQ